MAAFTQAFHSVSFFICYVLSVIVNVTHLFILVLLSPCLLQAGASSNPITPIHSSIRPTYSTQFTSHHLRAQAVLLSRAQRGILKASVGQGHIYRIGTGSPVLWDALWFWAQVKVGNIRCLTTVSPEKQTMAPEALVPSCAMITVITRLMSPN